MLPTTRTPPFYKDVAINQTDNFSNYNIIIDEPIILTVQLAKKVAVLLEPKVFVFFL